jgi:predicted O-linked N-acetylglucosamine transferase (SPINDLY family)
MAARLIKAIGAERGIAVTPAEYVETAIALASDRDAYADYRSLFTEERWTATIGNIADFTKAFEATLSGICRHGSV